MSDLYKKIESLCKEKGLTVTDLCRNSGVSRAALSDLKMGRKQSLSTKTLTKIANALHVPTDFLLGMEEKEMPALISRDERDLAKRLDKMLDELGDPQSSLMFDGEPIDEKTRELLRVSLQNQLEISKRIAKQKLTAKRPQK